MSSPIDNLRKRVASLTALDPNEKAVLSHIAAIIDDIQAVEQKVAQTTESTSRNPEVANTSGPTVPTVDGSTDMVKAADAVGRLYQAAGTTMRNYEKILGILEGLHSVIKVAAKPQNVAVRPRVASLVEKTAGVFALCDTVQDLDRPLADIEKAVHALYGDQSKNSTFYFDRRGKGHHDEK